ncbi:MAG: prepilin-type N-terminal cleavage/methylation domain-containing protein [Opitutaceae bacterium]|jgi:general secretion pathway protein G|nr:prepilin-type N-terminal cleavage/methylation domain-containing protein [Opitutaceae bacterium]
MHTNSPLSSRLRICTQSKIGNRKSKISRARRGGFTLIELLTVIAIIGILAAIIIPTAGRVRETARNVQCISNLRQIAGTARLYAEDHRNRTPQTERLTFAEQLWPYVQIDKGTPPVVATRELPAELANTIFECPVARKETIPPLINIRSYAMNICLAPPADEERKTRGIKLDLVKTPSRAAFFADSKNSSALTRDTCNARHNGKMNVAFVDGHVAGVEFTAGITTADAQTTHVFWTGQ